MEDWHGPSDPARRGTGGKVSVQPSVDPNPLAPAFLRAVSNLGFQVFDQQNGALQESEKGGASIVEVRIRNGRRLNSPEAFLYPVLHQSNVTLLTGAQVSKILFDGKTASGVEFEWLGSTHVAKVASEVILASGAIQTPKLLLLSGLGDRDHLEKFDIGVVNHLPGVGQNLQDHPIVGAGLWRSSGPVVPHNNAAEASLFAKSDETLDRPDLHIFNVEAPYLSERTFAYASENVWSISPGLVRPFSRGSIQLKSRNANDAPVINANMLIDERDLIALRKGMELTRSIGNDSAMKDFNMEEVLPGRRGSRELDDLIRDGVMSMHHATCTAKMGTDDMSVVDSSLRVHGVGNLRITDGSVMPTVTTGNTQAPIMMIAEKLGDIMGF